MNIKVAVRLIEGIQFQINDPQIEIGVGIIRIEDNDVFVHIKSLVEVPRSFVKYTYILPSFQVGGVEAQYIVEVLNSGGIVAIDKDAPQKHPGVEVGGVELG